VGDTRDKSATSGVTRRPWADLDLQQSYSTRALGFPLPPQSSPKPQTNPADKTKRHFWRFAKAEIASPAQQMRDQFGHCRFIGA
jgi:hypothetical protein